MVPSVDLLVVALVIDMVFGDELDKYRDAELQRLLGKSRETCPERE